MAFTVEIAGSQIDGARDYQEDAFLITHLTDAKGKLSSLVIVADGMGGHAAGNVASNMAVQAFSKSINADYPTDEISELLNQSLLKANASITDTVKETQALGGMGCTFVGVIVEGENLSWVSVGDSHLYLLRDMKLTKLNADHSYGGFLDRMAAAGTPVEAEPGLSRNMLMSALTGDDIAEVDCPTTPFTLMHNDKLIVSSDGLDTLSEGSIIQYSDWADNCRESAAALMKAVEEAAMPRQDNTTAVLIKVTDDSVVPIAIEEYDEDDSEDITIPGITLVEESAQADDASVLDIRLAKEPAQADDTVPGIRLAEEPAQADDTVPDIRLAEEPAKTRTDKTRTDKTRTKVEPDPPPVAVGSERPGRSNTGLMIGIAAVVFVAVAVGVYFMFGGSKSNVTSERVADETMTEEFVVEEDIADESSSADAIEIESSDEEEETMVTETVAEPETVVDIVKPAPKPSDKKEFQDDLKDGGKSPMMVVIPVGSFEMGSPSSSRFTDERPRHTVNVESIAVSKYEVTFAEYDMFAKATNRPIPKDLGLDRETYPVINVKWDDAYRYTKWLSEQTGKKYRLLSENEWEYAASTGKKSPFWWGYDAEPQRAHCFGCETGLDPRRPSRVGGFEPNKFGLHDTAGNVAEWVHDCWHENYDDAPKENEVWEGGDCAYRAVRGGAYISPIQSIRSAKRDKLRSDTGYEHVGIRLARRIN